ncbi:MAG: hypothetical protein A2166_05055 [Omnitrophica WOR_2 bacterium RBG_13_41_10]|nr:MAG: hypothetical protein A2166_05055 [Omnitrophica WOR_2 bacterium RBG_13_41_10]
MWSIGNSTERGFTFVELMITSVILLVGLVAIIQGFITATGAFNTTNNRLYLLAFMENKMQEIESAAEKESDLKKIDSTGQINYDSRKFAWILKINDVDGDYDPKLDEKLKEVKIEINWREQNYPKNLSLATYLTVKKE